MTDQYLFFADMEGFATIPFGPVNKLVFDDGQVASHDKYGYNTTMSLGKMANCTQPAKGCTLWSFTAAYVLPGGCTRALSSFEIGRAKVLLGNSDLSIYNLSQLHNKLVDQDCQINL